MNIEPAHFTDSFLEDILTKFAETHEEEVDWSGFLTRNKLHRVAVDFRLITKVQLDLEFVLNVSHRGDFEDGLTRPGVFAVGKFRASDRINQPIFDNYVRYFQEKGRAGIIETQSYLIFLIPPGVPVKHAYDIAPNELLGIFFKR